MPVLYGLILLEAFYEFAYTMSSANSSALNKLEVPETGYSRKN